MHAELRTLQDSINGLIWKITAVKPYSIEWHRLRKQIKELRAKRLEIFGL